MVPRNFLQLQMRLLAERCVRALVASSLLVFALTAEAQLYRWTDASGAVHYTDTPPPPGAKNVQKKESPRTASAQAPPAAQGPDAPEQAAKNFPVILYTANDCGAPCKSAREHLNRRRVPFAENIVAYQADVDALIKLAGAARVPVMVVGTTILKDYQRQDWDAALDKAGYPKNDTP